MKKLGAQYRFIDLSDYGRPDALPCESQWAVNIMYYPYQMCYGLFDRIVHTIDPKAYHATDYCVKKIHPKFGAIPIVVVYL